MGKVIARFFILIAVFGAGWFLTYQVDWVSLFKIKETSQNLESKLGDLYWEIIEKSSDVIVDDSIVAHIDSILIKVCKANSIDREDVKLHIINASEVNAFTLPDNHMIVNTGLVLSAESAEELAGVLCHELAHMTEHHIMEKLMKEIGLNVLISATGGGEIMGETLSVLSSTAFSRDMEREADEKAVDYLINAQINPEGFADFMYRLSQKESDFMQSLSWLSTHPPSEERAIEIVNFSKGRDYAKNELMSEPDWEKFQKSFRLSSNY